MGCVEGVSVCGCCYADCDVHVFGVGCEFVFCGFGLFGVLAAYYFESSGFVCYGLYYVAVALLIHSIACWILAFAVICRRAVSWMSVSLFCAAKCALIRAASGFRPSLIASCSHCALYHSWRSCRAWLYCFLCLLSRVACMVLYVIGGRSGSTSSFSLRM